MSILMVSCVVVLCVASVFLGLAVWRLTLTVTALDKVIFARLMDTSVVDKHNLLVHALTKFSDNDRARKDKEYMELKALHKSLEAELRNAKSVIEHLRKDR
jgi:hypothetical protein